MAFFFELMFGAPNTPAAERRLFEDVIRENIAVYVRGADSDSAAAAAHDRSISSRITHSYTVCFVPTVLIVGGLHQQRVLGGQVMLALAS
jgi:hypothetical protein